MKSDTKENIAVGAIVGVGFVAILASAFFLGGAAIWAAWNYGVAAVWMDAPHLAYWPACFIGLGLGVLRSGGKS